MTVKSKGNLLPLHLQFFAEDQTDVDNKDADKTDDKTADDNKSIPYDRFKAKVDEVNTIKSTLNELGFDDLDKLKSFTETANNLITKNKEREREEMTEMDRLKSDLEKAKETITTLSGEKELLTGQIKQSTLTSQFKQAIAKNGVPDQYHTAALKLADLDSLALEEDGSVKGLDEAVKTLLSEHTFLQNEKQNEPDSIGGSSNPKPDGDDKKTAKKILNEYAERARKSGRTEDMVAYMKKKRELANE